MFPIRNIYSSLTCTELNTSFSPLLISCWSKGTLQSPHAICWHGKQGKWLCRCKKVSETGLWVLLLETTEGPGFCFYTSCLSTTIHSWGLSWLIGLHWWSASPLPPAPIAFFCIPFLRDDSDIKVHKGLVYQALKQGRLQIPALNSVYWTKNTEQTETLPPKSIVGRVWGGVRGVCVRGNRKERLNLFSIKQPISKMKEIGREGKNCQ